MILELVEDAWRRPEWAATLLRVDEVGGRYERVHRNRLADFQRGLVAVVSGDADTATLTSLARASEIVVRRDAIQGRFTAHEDDTTVEFSRRLNDGDLASCLQALEEGAKEVWP